MPKLGSILEITATFIAFLMGLRVAKRISGKNPLI